MKSPQLKSPPLNNSFYILYLEENINKLKYRVVLLTLFDHLLFQHSLLIILIINIESAENNRNLFRHRTV